jgi:hypothetical protein
MSKPTLEDAAPSEMVETQTSAAASGDDPLLDPNFSVTHHVNMLFPTGQDTFLGIVAGSNNLCLAR